MLSSEALFTPRRGGRRLWLLHTLPFPQNASRTGEGAARSQAGPQGSTSLQTRGGASVKAPGAGLPPGLGKAPKMAGSYSARGARRRHRGRPSASLGRPKPQPHALTERHPPMAIG